MWATRVIRRTVTADNFRYFSRNTVCANKPSASKDTHSATNTETSNSPSSKSGAHHDNILGSQMFAVSTFQKFILVLVKRYPNMKSVPNQVSKETICHANDRARVITCNVLMVIALSYCAYVIWNGKKHVSKKTGNEEIDKLRQYYKSTREENAAVESTTVTAAK